MSWILIKKDGFKELNPKLNNKAHHFRSFIIMESFAKAGFKAIKYRFVIIAYLISFRKLRRADKIASLAYIST